MSERHRACLDLAVLKTARRRVMGRTVRTRPGLIAWRAELNQIDEAISRLSADLGGQSPKESHDEITPIPKDWITP